MPAEVVTPAVESLPQASPTSHHIRLTSHTSGYGALPIHWAAATATMADNTPIGLFPSTFDTLHLNLNKTLR